MIADALELSLYKGQGGCVGWGTRHELIFYKGVKGLSQAESTTMPTPQLLELANAPRERPEPLP